MKKRTIICLSVLMILLLTGCGQQQASRPPQEVAVKAIQVIQKSTPVTYEFVGEIVAKDEVPIKAQISGNIANKLIKGGDTVQAGQPLFEIDRRKYVAAVADAQAQVANSLASLSNIRRDVLRYQDLASHGGIALQTLDTTKSQAEQAEAQVKAYEAKLEQSENDLTDTLIVSPVDGRIGVGELSVGEYVTSGSTVMATVSTVDPVLVRFSMSENEYLKFAQIGTSPIAWGQNLKLILSNGTEYPLFGNLEQVDRGMVNQTGTLAMKAAFPNPQQLLIPGMFARIAAVGETRPGALLIPQRAIQEMLGKSFVTIVGPNSEAVTRQVTLGPKVDNLQIIEDGLTADDVVVVEGFAKTQPGSPLKVTMIGLNDLTIPVAK